MTIPKYILLSIIYSIPLPISNNAHIFILKDIFNTNIFNHHYTFYTIINSGIIFSLLYIFNKNKTSYKITKHNIKISISNLINILFLSTIPLLITLLFKNIIPTLYKYHLKIIPISLITTSIFLFIISKSNYIPKKLKTIHFIITGIVNTLSIIPGQSTIITTLLMFRLFKLDKKTSIKYTLISTIITTISITLYHINKITFPLYPYTICIITISVISYYSLNKFIKLYISNKLKRLILSLILISIFIMYWFR